MYRNELTFACSEHDALIIGKFDAKYSLKLIETPINRRDINSVCHDHKNF